jgi:hypothetical protein
MKNMGPAIIISGNGEGEKDKQTVMWNELSDEVK